MQAAIATAATGAAPRRLSINDGIGSGDAMARDMDGDRARKMTMDGDRARKMTMAAGDASDEPLRDDGMAAAAPGAPSASKTGLSATVLAAASLQMLTVLCCTPAHIATAKSLGVIRAMLAANTAHSASGDVYAAFADLVEGIVTEDEVAAAVRDVGAATAQLRALANDESLFAIEDKELASEGGALAAVPGDAAAAAASAKGKGGKVPPPQKGGAAAQAAPSPKEARATALAVGVALTEHLCLLETACSRCVVARRAAGVAAAAALPCALLPRHAAVQRAARQGAALCARPPRAPQVHGRRGAPQGGRNGCVQERRGLEARTPGRLQGPRWHRPRQPDGGCAGELLGALSHRGQTCAL